MNGSQPMRGKPPAEGIGQPVPHESLVVAGREPDLHEGGNRVDPAGREYQELWFALARVPWRSLALVPGDSGASAKDIAASLASVGRVLHESVSTLVPVDTLDYFPVAELLLSIGATTKATGPRAVKPPEKIIAALPSVVSDPLGLQVVAAADMVVICVEIGRTRVSSLRRTIELVGRERIAGCLLID